MRFAKCFECSEPVQLRHLDVEDDDVRYQAVDFPKGKASVRRHADYFEICVLRQNLRHHPANDERVVND